MRRVHWILLAVAALALEGALTPAYLAYRLPPYTEMQRRHAAFETLVAALDEVRRSVGQRRSIGFLCDGRVDPSHPDANLARYYLAQSWLAPVLVGRELDPGLSLASFSTPARLSESVDRLDLQVLHPVAPGLALVEGRAP